MVVVGVKVFLFGIYSLHITSSSARIAISLHKTVFQLLIVNTNYSTDYGDYCRIVASVFLFLPP